MGYKFYGYDDFTITDTDEIKKKHTIRFDSSKEVYLFVTADGAPNPDFKVVWANGGEIVNSNSTGVKKLFETSIKMIGSPAFRVPAGRTIVIHFGGHSSIYSQYSKYELLVFYK